MDKKFNVLSIIGAFIVVFGFMAAIAYFFCNFIEQKENERECFCFDCEDLETIEIDE